MIFISWFLHHLFGFRFVSQADRESSVSLWGIFYYNLSLHDEHTLQVSSIGDACDVSNDKTICEYNYKVFYILLDIKGATSSLIRFKKIENVVKNNFLEDFTRMLYSNEQKYLYLIH